VINLLTLSRDLDLT